MVKDIYIQPLPQTGSKLSGGPAEHPVARSFNFPSHLWKSLNLYAIGY